MLNIPTGSERVWESEIEYHPEIISFLYNQSTDPGVCNEGYTKAGGKLERADLQVL